MTRLGVAAGLAFLLVIVAIGLAYRLYRKHQNALAFAISAPNGISEARFVTIGGIDQWVTIRGQDRDNPVLLILHGGSGLATSPLFAWFRPWEEAFTVI